MGETTLTKKQKLLAGVVCAMIVLTLVDSALSLWNLLGNPEAEEFLSKLHFVMFSFGALFNVLILLKFLLSGWKPHKNWLSLLLGILLLFGGVAVASLVPMLQEIYYSIGQAYRDSMPAASDGMTAIWVIVFALCFIVLLLFNPYLHLLRGLWRGKSTEKTAGRTCCAWAGGFGDYACGHNDHERHRGGGEHRNPGNQGSRHAY